MRCSRSDFLPGDGVSPDLLARTAAGDETARPRRDASAGEGFAEPGDKATESRSSLNFSSSKRR